MKSKCEKCPYNQDKLGNECGNDTCIQEAIMFDVCIEELKGAHKNNEC